MTQAGVIKTSEVWTASSFSAIGVWLVRRTEDNADNLHEEQDP